MSRTSFLQYLIQEVFAPDIEKGTFTFLPETTTLHEVQEHYEPQLGTALQMEEGDWEFIVQELEHWYERKLQEDPSHRSYLQREALWDEMLAQCEQLPSYDQVAEKLGIDVAETFLSDMESIENMPHGPEVGIEGRKKNFSKKVMEDITTLMSMLSVGDREVSITEYEQQKRSARKSQQIKRERIRDHSEPYRERARGLGVWFPYPGQLGSWKADARTAMYFPYLDEMLKRVKRKMKQEHCIMQYIPKRRLTAKTAEELPRNLENMGRYLMEDP